MDFTANQNKKQQLQEKEKQLAAVMDEYGKESVCLAFSGGVDSSLLLKLACAAARRHGTKVWAVTFDTMLHPVCDLENARKVAKEMDADHVVLSVDELEQEELRNNPVNRCYLCKRRLFLRLQEFAGEKGCSLLLDGTNADDLEEYRPGLAALRELGVKSPLASCGLTKKEVKALAGKYGISAASRPSAPCMATRLPYGARLDYDLLKRIEAGTLEFTYDYVDINAVLRDLEQSAHLKNKNPDVQISFKDYLEPCVIYTDRNRLSQLMINLLNNAMKFTQAGLISFGYKLRDDNTLWFYVEDTGCGIPENKRKDIFGRFVKLNTFAQGTGLGLSICEMIVTQMKGTIGVDSMEGKGSKFWFTLPFQPKKELFPSEEQKPVTLEKIARSEVTILIAEDNSSNYRLFESILKPEYKLIHAWNGKEAVELFHQHKPQLILMDIKMPVMDGYEATAEIRKVSASVPIIAVTAYAFAQDDQRIINSGFDAYTAKPINGKILKDKISTLLTHRIILM